MTWSRLYPRECLEKVPAVVFGCLRPRELRIILYPGYGMADGGTQYDVPGSVVPPDLWMPNTPLWVQLDADFNVVRVWRREGPAIGLGNPVEPDNTPPRSREVHGTGAGREEFLQRLSAEFPDVVAGFGLSAGSLHCEMGDFRRASERAMDEGRLWEAERHFLLVEELLKVAGPELRNALEVSYLEDLALGECTPARHLAVKERMPKALRDVLIAHREKWK